MAGKGIRTYEQGAASNVALGQAGATIIAETSVHTVKNGVWVAITFLADSTITTLTAESADFFGSGSGADNIETVTGGTTVSDTTASVTFPKGSTIFGRWTVIDLATGSCIAYRG